MSKRLNSRWTLFCGLVAWTVLCGPAATAQNVQELKLTLGKSIVIDYPADIGRISTSNPEVADYVAVTTREILIHAKSHGTATLIVWSRSGQREFYAITVEHNLDPIRKILKSTFPSEDIQIQAARDTLALTGSVSSQLIADRALALVTPLGKSVLNNLRVNPPKAEKQVLLRVRFAELNRNAARSFGVNLVSTGAGNTIGRITSGGTPAPTPSQISGGGSAASFSITDALNIFAFRPDLNIGAFIKALQAEGVLQILAEPNLVTTNGKEASFLVGGEFPVPILQGGSNAGAVTVQFREFGIRLSFNPQVTENGTVRLYVKPEVNTLDLANSVTIAGFSIPALATRKIETNIELGEGQSFVIGGLLDDRVTDTMSKIPGLSGIPLLGSLFKSRTENRSKSELIVMVTPEITTPLSPADPRPKIDFPKEFMKPLPPAASGTGPGAAANERKQNPAKKAKGSHGAAVAVRPKES
ncbi:MAG: type II and III secretion system protein family protein [Acidobacteria bacterium]|nr:type II and III secretion system protein family protein [Acidobacteriota bacterium]